MADRDAKERLKSLAEAAANFNPDSHIPIRRYFRWLTLIPRLAWLFFLIIWRRKGLPKVSVVKDMLE